MQGDYMDLSGATKIVSVDVYSDIPFDMLARVNNGVASSSDATPVGDSATDASHPGGGWATLSFDFTVPKDGLGAASGIYQKIYFFNLWDSSAGGGAGGWICGAADCSIVSTTFVDNITALAASPPATCTDGMMNGNETGVDCGGPDCGPCVTFPAGPAPLPGSPDAETFSVYDGNLPGDVTTFSTNWPFAYQFGDALTGEVDLDPGADVNGAWQINFANGGYGQGEGPVNATQYDFVSFDYWANTGLIGFRIVMISNAGTPLAEVVYEVGTNEAIVSESWTKVVIPMSYFTNLGFAETNFFQWKFDPFAQSVDNIGTVFIDNFLLTENVPTVLSVNDFETTQFKTYPNPTSSDWNISSNSIIKSVVLYDILGKQVMSLTPNASDAIIEASSLNPGMYFAEINGINGSKTVKLIKE